MKSIILTIILFLNVLPAKPIIIKLATLAPEGTEWHGLLVEMGQRWKEATNGEVILRIYPSGVVGDERDMIRKIRIGQIHSAAVTTEGLSEIIPEITAFIIPLLFDDFDDVDWIRERISDDLEKGMEASGFKLLYWADVDWAFWFSKSPIIYPEDLKDRKIFNWAGDYKSAELWESGGFNPVPLASIDVLTGLQTGLIDAIGTTPIYALSMQWFGIADYMLDMKWGLITAGVILDLRTWNRIPPEYQVRVAEIAREIGAQHQKKNRYGGRRAIQVMEEHGLKVHKQTPSEKEHWDEYIKSWHPNIRGKMVPTDIFNKVIRLKAEKDSLDRSLE